MGEARGKVSGRGPHRGDDSSTGWQEAADTAAFHCGVGGDVREVLQLREGKGVVRHEENRRRKRSAVALTEEGRGRWRQLQIHRSRWRIPPVRRTNGNVGSLGRWRCGPSCLVPRGRGEKQKGACSGFFVEKRGNKGGQVGVGSMCDEGGSGGGVRVDSMRRVQAVGGPGLAAKQRRRARQGDARGRGAERGKGSGHVGHYGLAGVAGPK
jgi:hypothetical protein